MGITHPRWRNRECSMISPVFQVMTFSSYWTTRVAMQLDAYDTAHPLYNLNVETIPQIENMFGTLSYAKVSLIKHITIKIVRFRYRYNRSV